MIAQKTYLIETKMSKSFNTMDAEEYAALVSAMRNLARFCGMNILTYHINSAKLSMLVSCPARDHHLRFFEDWENESRGSGLNRLYQHLHSQYSHSYVKELANKLETMRNQGKNTLPVIERYTGRIGIPKKFAEAVGVAFTRWIKENRPQMYQDLRGNICRKGITLAFVDQLQKQRDLAISMDWDAVHYDDGEEPREYWCGYADALRGDEDALDGLRELVKSPASSAQEIKELGYCDEPLSTKGSRAKPRARPSRRKKTTVRTGEGSESRVQKSWIGKAEEPETPETLEAYQLSGKWLKYGLVGVFIAVAAVGVFVIGKNWNKGMVEENSGNNIPQQQLAEVEQQKKKEEELVLTEITSLLYQPEARQLAQDFAKSGDPTARLKMSRNPQQTSSRMVEYSVEALELRATEVDFMDVVDLGGIMAARSVAKFDNSLSRLICVVPTLDGLRVDWDCYARYNSKAWPKLIDGSLKSAELRVFAKRSDYYNFEYRDESKWIGFELLSPDSDQPLYAYAARGTTTAKLLGAALPVVGSGKSIQLTVRLSSGGGDHKWKQFTIDRLLAFGWVIPEQDIEHSYRSTIHELVK
jgi:hypothetical protein